MKIRSIGGKPSGCRLHALLLLAKGCEAVFEIDATDSHLVDRRIEERVEQASRVARYTDDAKYRISISS